MSVATDAVLILLGVVFLLFVGFAIPCVLEIRRTAKEMTMTLRTFNETLPVIMKNLDRITTEVSQATTAVHGQIDDLSLMIKKVKGAMFVLAGLDDIIRRRVHLPIAPTVRTFFAVSKGVRVFLNHLLSERSKGC